MNPVERLRFRHRSENQIENRCRRRRNRTRIRRVFRYVGKRGEKQLGKSDRHRNERNGHENVGFSGGFLVVFRFFRLIIVIGTRAEFEILDLSKVRPHDPLHVAVEHGGISDNALEFLFPFAPQSLHGAFFSFQIVLHRTERADDVFYFRAEFRPGKVPVKEFHFFFAPDHALPLLREREKLVAEGLRERKEVFRFGHPYAFVKTEMADAFRYDGRYEDAHVRLGENAVVLEFLNPLGGKRLGIFRFPENYSGIAGVRIANAVYEIGAANARGNVFDGVGGEIAR